MELFPFRFHHPRDACAAVPGFFAKEKSAEEPATQSKKGCQTLQKLHDETLAGLGKTPGASYLAARKVLLAEDDDVVSPNRFAGDMPAEAPPLMRQPPAFDRMPARPAPRAHDSRVQDPVSEYAKKGAPQGLDPLGRPAPVHNSPEDDQLDIPAFLRRQAN